jgi:signal transduction histidine kinase
MRLAFKMFAASTLVILALVAVGAWSLLAVDHLVRAHRDITDHSLPALQLEVSLQDAVPRLLRLEARYLVLRDRAYGNVLRERVDWATADLARLDPLLKSVEERKTYHEAVAALASYGEHVSKERDLLGRGQAGQALRLSEGPARSAIERFDETLTRLTRATSAEVGRAQVAVQALEGRTWTTVLATLSVSVLAAVGAVGFVAFRLTRSIRRLSAATGRVADGSFKEPLPVESRDEIGDLTRSFNHMAERLREVEGLKEYFFAQISHELRNPLTAIRGSAQLLLARTRDALDSTQRHWLETIDGSVDRLLGLVNRILDFNRLRAGVFPLERQPIAFDKVVARALDMLRPQAEREGRAVDETSEGADFVITADEEALTQVVFNLVGNAIKFTPEGGSVHVGVKDAGTHVELAVRDTGPGIPRADAARIFEPYQQAHSGRKGAGLGLAIVKELVDAHGGSIQVDSEEGKGACFSVRLPKAAPTT